MGARADVAPTSPPVHLRYTGRKKQLVPPQKGRPNHSSPSAVLLAGLPAPAFASSGKNAKSLSGEQGRTPFPPRREPLQAPRGTAALGSTTAAEAHTASVWGQPRRRSTQFREKRPETNLTLRRAGCEAATGRPVLPPHLYVGKPRPRENKRLGHDRTGP